MAENHNEISLTNSQYSAIFDAVINHIPSQRSIPEDLSPNIGLSPKYYNNEPIECASESNSQYEKLDNVLENIEQRISDIENCEKRKLRRRSGSKTPNILSQKEELLLKKRKQKKKKETKSSNMKKKLKKGNSDLTFQEALSILKDSHTESSFNDSFSMELQEMPLSQPPEHFTHRERLEWLQERRNVGLWVMCSSPTCNKWRWLEDTKDPTELPEEWFCFMNPDKNFNNCLIPEKGPTVHEELDLIENEYTAGSIVWGRVAGYPWWPGMVDDDPDTEQYYWLEGYSDIPTHYHVIFFDSELVSRSWLTPKAILAYHKNPHMDKKSVFKTRAKFAHRLQIAKSQAEEALKMTVKERLTKWSFLARWTKTIKSPVITSVSISQISNDNEEFVMDNTKINKKICNFETLNLRLKENSNYEQKDLDSDNEVNNRYIKKSKIIKKKEKTIFHDSDDNENSRLVKKIISNERLDKKNIKVKNGKPKKSTAKLNHGDKSADKNKYNNNASKKCDESSTNNSSNDNYVINLQKKLLTICDSDSDGGQNNIAKNSSKKNSNKEGKNWKKRESKITNTQISNKTVLDEFATQIPVKDSLNNSKNQKNIELDNISDISVNVKLHKINMQTANKNDSEDIDKTQILSKSYLINSKPEKAITIDNNSISETFDNSKQCKENTQTLKKTDSEGNKKTHSNSIGLKHFKKNTKSSDDVDTVFIDLGTVNRNTDQNNLDTVFHEIKNDLVNYKTSLEEESKNRSKSPLKKKNLLKMKENNEKQSVSVSSENEDLNTNYNTEKSHTKKCVPSVTKTFRPVGLRRPKSKILPSTSTEKTEKNNDSAESNHLNKDLEKKSETNYSEKAYSSDSESIYSERMGKSKRLGLSKKRNSIALNKSFTNTNTSDTKSVSSYTETKIKSHIIRTSKEISKKSTDIDKTLSENSSETELDVIDSSQSDKSLSKTAINLQASMFKNLPTLEINKNVPGFEDD